MKVEKNFLIFVDQTRTFAAIKKLVVAIHVVIVAICSAITMMTCCTFLKKVIIIIKTLAPCVPLR